MMQALESIAEFLLPWEFAPLMFAFCAGAVLLYGRGLRRAPSGSRESRGRIVCYFSGWAIIYVALLTQFEYLSTHMFFLHTLQQMAVHHLGGNPGRVSTFYERLPEGTINQMADTKIHQFGHG